MACYFVACVTSRALFARPPLNGELRVPHQQNWVLQHQPKLKSNSIPSINKQDGGLECSSRLSVASSANRKQWGLDSHLPRTTLIGWVPPSTSRVAFYGTKYLRSHRRGRMSYWCVEPNNILLRVEGTHHWVPNHTKPLEGPPKNT